MVGLESQAHSTSVKPTTNSQSFHRRTFITFASLSLTHVGCVILALFVDSLFHQIEKEYVSLKKEVEESSKGGETEAQPSVITELKFGSAWYVPGGKSTVARLLADAGANYIFADNTNSGSVPLSFETVFDKGQDADFWLIKYNQPIDKTYTELASDYAPYKNFEAWKEQRIFGCNTNKVNFYEESPFHPERLLKDLIKIFYPSLLPNYDLVYYSPLK